MRPVSSLAAAAEDAVKTVEGGRGDGGVVVVKETPSQVGKVMKRMSRGSGRGKIMWPGISLIIIILYNKPSHI